MTSQGVEKPSFAREFSDVWRALPYKGLFGVLFGAWLLLFQFWGNSTLGYVNTPSLFQWLNWIYDNSVDDEHGRLIPIVVAVLFWWKRKELLSIEKRHWWPAFSLILLGLMIHFVGFLIQQTRLSIVGFALGLYGITGVVWGPKWLARTLFPFFLFAFCVPIAVFSDGLTFPLRLMATKATTFCANNLLGMNVIQDGTRIFDSAGTYQYEVAAACSGLRSLTAIFAMATIYAFVGFTRPGKRLLMISMAFPLAVAANVFRLMLIIFSSEIWGPKAGHYVHDSSWLSLLPYVPAVVGLFLAGKWFAEREPVITNPAPYTKAEALT